LWELNRTRVFQAGEGRLQHYSMLLDETQERLIIGGKDILYSLNLERITAPHKEIHWPSSEEQVGDCLMQGREKPECANYIKLVQHYNSTHLLACGTGAFSPVCAYIRVGRGTELKGEFRLESDHIESGRGRCPFHPNSPSASTVHQPKFVGSAVIPDNDDPADDKVYYFFTERVANMEGGNKAVYTRVARVCANDQGGQRMLVNRWSSFLKTRLICSVAGPNGIDTHFDELEDVFVLRKKDEKNPEIFGLFSTTSAVFKGYAVCMYNMEDIRAAFNGPFAYRERTDHHWKVYDGKVPYPRPGSCASKVNGGQFSSSKEYPDEVLRFVRSHPLMFQAVQPVHRQPILLDTEGGRKLTQLAVDRVEAEDGHYNVLFIGTDNSVVLKMITIYNKEANAVEEVLLEELQVFKVPVPITEILISTKRVKGDDRVIQTPHGLLLLKIVKGDAGVYVCQSTEHGFVQTVVRVTLEVLDEGKVEGLLHKGEEDEGDSPHRPPPCHFPSLPAAPSSSKLWYRDFMQLIGYSNFQRVEQYCEKVWCVSDRKRKKLKGMAPKWRYTPGAEQRARARAPRHTQGQ
ncbi:hypothetical protein cypCar_00022777, partial [Cyprinus carpio]